MKRLTLFFTLLSITFLLSACTTAQTQAIPFQVRILWHRSKPQMQPKQKPIHRQRNLLKRRKRIRRNRLLQNRWKRMFRRRRLSKHRKH